jgi:hypothetical protein
MFYVKLKQPHALNSDEADQVREMELPTPEDRWPFPEGGLKLIEVFKKGTKQECQEFIDSIDGECLKTQFEIIAV